MVNFRKERSQSLQPPDKELDPTAGSGLISSASQRFTDIFPIYRSVCEGGWGAQEQAERSTSLVSGTRPRSSVAAAVSTWDFTASNIFLCFLVLAAFLAILIFVFWCLLCLISLMRSKNTWGGEEKPFHDVMKQLDRAGMWLHFKASNQAFS